MISSNEALTLVSNVCMGANAGIIKNIDTYSLRGALFSSMPASLALKMQEKTPIDRDVKRAQILQNVLGGNNI